MKRIIFNMLFCICGLGLSAQNKISSYQYWFDDQLARAVTTNITPVQNFTLSAQVNATALLDGLHLFSIRFTDDSSRRSVTSSSLFYKMAPVAGGTNIVSFQYWFDNRFYAAVTQGSNPAPSYVLSEELNTAGLLDGLHLLQARFKDDHGLWSETLSHLFYKGTSVSSGNTIVGFRYWFNQDINNISYQTISPGVSYTMSAPVSTMQLLDGSHVLNAQFLDSNRKWSSVVAHYFYKIPPATGAAVNRLKYWFDQDYAGAIHQNVTPSAVYDFSDQINAASLSNGLHTLSVRFADNHNKWSSTISHFFYKDQPATVSENRLTAYRYWFDQGDSILNLVNIAPFMNPFIINQQLAADGMDSGRHEIHFQFRDVKGQWSMVTSDSISVETKAVYTFNGNGNWSDPSNWVNKIKPPVNATGTYRIFVDPVTDGKCILDTGQQISSGAVITVKAGKSFIVPGVLQLNQ